MTDRDRLKKVLNEAFIKSDDNFGIPNIEQVADYLIVNGVILPPCNVGDTIYFDTFKCGKEIGIQPHKVSSINVAVEIERTFGNIGAEIPDWAFGKTVFLTREEAEKALKERPEK